MRARLPGRQRLPVDALQPDGDDAVGFKRELCGDDLEVAQLTISHVLLQ